MTDTEVITLSEITQESITVIESATAGISSDLVTKLQSEIVTWNTEHDDVDFEFAGEGVNLEGQRLLDAITRRVRVWLGFPALVNNIKLPGSVVISSHLSW